MIAAQERMINGQLAKLYRDGIRDAYYVTSDGVAYSYSHNKGIVKELKPDKARKFPTLRFNLEENGLKVRYNIPMYRIVYELFIDSEVDWNYTRVQYKDNNTHNFRSSNLIGVANYKSEILSSAFFLCSISQNTSCCLLGFIITSANQKDRDILLPDKFVIILFSNVTII